MAFLFCPEKTQKRGESGLKNFCIPIFFKVVQGNPIKYLLLTFLRFSKKFLKECVSDSCHKGKPRRSKLSYEGRN